MQLLRVKIKSQILSLVVTIALVIFTFLSGFFLIDFYDHYFVNSYLSKDTGLHNLNSGETILLSNPKEYNSPKGVSLLDEEPQITLENKKWGIYDIGLIRSVIGKDTLDRSIVIGYTQEEPYCLKLSYTNSYFKLAGNSNFKGQLIVPGKQLDRANISSKPYTGTKIQFEYLIASEKINQIKLSDFKIALEQSVLSDKDSSAIFQSFKDPTLLIDEVGSYESISGNILVESNYPLVIPRSIRLNNIIVKAPSIIIQSGFVGSAQFIAEDSIIVNDRVELEFPSTLIVNSSKKLKSVKIKIGNDCLVNGNIEIQNKSIVKDKVFLGIGSRVKVNGKMIVDGLANVQDLELNGSLEAYKVITKYGNSVHYNTLIDVDFDALKLKKYGLMNAGKVAKRMKLIEDEN